MSTRALLVIVFRGKRCLAITGQYDGYPSYEGCIILRFISDEDNLRKLSAALSRPIFRSISKSDLEDINRYRREVVRRENTADISRPWPEEINRSRPHPSFSPDNVSDILPLIIAAEGDGVLPVEDSSQDIFLGADYVYVIDLDEYQFEVYSGLTVTDCVLGDRFEDLLYPYQGEYMTPVLLKRWDLSDLPSEAEFVSVTEPDADF